MATSVTKTVTPETPVLLATGLKSIIVYNMGPYPIFLGGPSVTEDDGYPLPAGSNLAPPVSLLTLESLYAIAQSGTSDVRVLSYQG